MYMRDDNEHDSYTDACDYFTSTIDHLENCIKLMWVEMGTPTFHPGVDRQQSFLKTYPEWGKTIISIDNKKALEPEPPEDK